MSGCPPECILGSNANNSANAGLSYANTNNTPSNTNTNISSQYAFKFQYISAETVPLGKK